MENKISKGAVSTDEVSKERNNDIKTRQSFGFLPTRVALPVGIIMRIICTTAPIICNSMLIIGIIMPIICIMRSIACTVRLIIRLLCLGFFMGARRIAGSVLRRSFLLHQRCNNTKHADSSSVVSSELPRSDMLPEKHTS